MAKERDPWFRVWASDSLQSHDLGALTPVEEMVWWRLLCATSIAEPRWTAPINAHLGHMCKVNPTQLAKALQRMAGLGMVTIQGETVTVANGPKYNPPRKPSDEPEAVRERVTKHRETRYRGDTNGVTPGVTNAFPSRARATDPDPESEIRSPIPLRGMSPRAAKRPITDDQRAELLLEFTDLGDAIDQIELALSHKAASRYTDLRLYVRNWLKREREFRAERGNRNGRSAHSRSGNGEDAKRAAEQALRAQLAQRDAAREAARIAAEREAVPDGLAGQASA